MNKYWISKKIAIAMAFIMLFQISFPVMSFALTAGPSQPEFQSFEPVGTTDMVDLFSGDFNYNIPLLEVGGYPINIAYHAGIGMEQEASWVGLGWNLNPGAVNRNMRGIPDDFSGERITKEVYRKPNQSVSFIAQPKAELIGLPANFKIGVGVRQNSYKGLSILGSASIGLDIVDMSGFKLNTSLGVDLDGGISIKPSMSTNYQIDKKKNEFASINIGAPYNSREGLTELSFTKQFLKEGNKDSKNVFYRKDRAAPINNTLVNFNTPSYITKTDFDAKAFAFSLDIHLGFEPPFQNYGGNIIGSYSRHSINGFQSLAAYGYMNHHLANPGIDLLDFNREKDGPYFDGSNVLPLTNLTNDIFSISGQGMGGAFRGFRNQVNYVSDTHAHTDSDGGSVGLDLGVVGSTITFKGGANLATHIVNSNSGLWRRENNALGIYNSQALPSAKKNKLLFENSYIKQLGELSSDKGRFNNLGGMEPVAFEIDENELLQDLKHGQTIINPIQEERASRNQLTIARTYRDVIAENYFRRVNSYAPGLVNGALEIEKDTLVRHYSDLFNDVGDNQIFEYEVLRPDGMRYVYGQPTYNLSQEETIFATNATFPNSSGNISYWSSHLTSSSSRGLDDFVSIERMNEFTNSHLLTEVLSADYSDLTNNGPSDDDYGTWVKFNYTCQAGKMSDTGESYKWRFPFQVNPSGSSGRAQFNEGLKSNDEDNKGSYTYGEKELWFVHSIESKSHIAVFHTSDRADAVGVDNRLGKTTISGTMGSANQQLDRIDYYAKHDLTEHGANATPIKSVHFQYDYSLCKNVPNNFDNTTESGKLTLTHLWFTYGNSNKGQFAKYAFDYNHNPNYAIRSQDRWGTYKPEISGLDYHPNNIQSNQQNHGLSNTDWPYAEQDKVSADNNALAWNLSTVHLPSGGKIDISYESDDYAYIQDKRAGQMFKLVGFADQVPNHSNQVSVNLVKPGTIFNNSEFNNHLIIKLNEASTNEISTADFERLYLADVDKLYFRVLTNIKDQNYEFVPGYANIESYGTFHSDLDGVGDYAWIKLKGVGYDENDSIGNVNPIAKAGWQFARLNMPELVYPGSGFDESTEERLIKQLAGIFTKEIPRMINGFNKNLANEGYSKNCVPKKSWVRLSNPDFHKKGGGCRVSKIILSDEWATMNGTNDNNQNSEYGQHFFYEKEIVLDNGESQVISSGVSSYEPLLGNDENPFKQPIVTNESRFLAPDNEHYIEKPIGESFYPSANVGYSQVIVADHRPDNISDKVATGYRLSEFYTAKDFPYQVKINEGDFYKYEPRVLNQLFKFAAKDFVTATKGYSIILNDMHGKPKKVSIYGGALDIVNDELDIAILTESNFISGSEYLYKTDAENNLDNEVDAVQRDGSISKETIGIESEIALDFREHYTRSIRVEVQSNFDTWILPLPIPPTIILPTFWPNYGDQETRFRSSVATKLINQHGLLERTRTLQNGSIIEAKNLLYDSQTGDVLVSSVNNEFRNTNLEPDPLVSEDNLIYNMSFPAHWAYKGMGQASQNIGVEVDINLTSSGDIPVDFAEELFYPGDELAAWGRVVRFAIASSPMSTKFWVLDVEAGATPNTPGTIKLVDQNGTIITDDYEIFGRDVLPEWNLKVVKSGYKNQQSNAIVSLSSMNNPATNILSGATQITEELDVQAEEIKVLEFAAKEYDDDWDSYCGEGGLQTIIAQQAVEFCYECADVLFLIDVSSSIVSSEFESMRQDVQQTIDGLNMITDGSFRYSIVFFNTSAHLQIPFTYNASQARNFGRGGFTGSTSLHNGMEDINDMIDTDPKMLPRMNCGLNICVFTDAESKLNSSNVLISNLIDLDHPQNPYQASIDLKANEEAVISMVRYRQHDDVISDEQGAGIVSPGWSYIGTVGDNNYDETETPRRFIPTSFGSPIPNIHSILTCETDTVDLSITQPILCGVNDGDIINPFVHGIKGNWRVKNTYAHKNVERFQSEVNSNTGIDLDEKGYYSQFDQFWKKPDLNEKFWSPNVSNYTKATEITIYNPYGEILEEKDALGNYSSVIMGYDKKLPIAVGGNSKYQEMAYDGFEEYAHYLNNDVCHANYHLDFEAQTDLSNTEAHTGYYSYELDPSTNKNFIFPIQCDPPSTISNSQCPYEINLCEECLTRFNPTFKTESDAENRFVVDAWIKDQNGTGTITIGIKQIGSPTVYESFSPSGPIIDGWQRVYEFFDFLPSVEEIEIGFENPSSQTIFLDDFRIYPFDANMKSFVYHPSSLKLVAELDENNHASFYEYDEEWNLVRLKKETERGIMTLQENRKSSRLNRN